MTRLAEASCQHVIDIFGQVGAPAVADPDERGKPTSLQARSRISADERAEQFEGLLE